jgi:acetyl esterase
MKTKPISFSYMLTWLAAPALAGGLLLAGCNSQPTATEQDATATVVENPDVPPVTGDSAALAAKPAGEVKPTGPAPAWAPTIKPEMLAVIEQLESFKPKPLPELTPAQARKQAGPTEAAMKQMRMSNIPMPPMNCDTMSKSLSGVMARIYTPKGGTAPYPVIVYYHGGGWVIANLDTYGPSTQALCEQAGAIVVSVAYRQAPEHKFPTAHDDSFKAYEWVVKNAATIKGDPTRIAVAGESAGGNLACAVSMMARDRKVALPRHQLLVYPIAGYDMNTPSYQKNTESKPLNKAAMAWFFKHYLRTPADGKDPRINLVGANLKGLPPTTIIGAEIDPLMSEGKTLADKLQAAGVPVKYQLYDGVTHEFFGMAAVVPQAKEAQAMAVDGLKSGLK